THRLGEVFEITDSVAVMRDGKVVFSGPTASVSRTQLIEHITGTAVARTREPWRPQEPEADRKELLRVEDMTLPGVVEHASFSGKVGDIRGIAGLVGVGRTELVRLIFGAAPHSAGRVFVHGVEQ